MKKLLLSAGVLLLLAQCKKDHLSDTTQAAELTVPAFSETGDNTFGAYLDGKPWANFGYQWITGLYSNHPAQNVPNAVTTAPSINNSGDSLYTISAELTVTQNGQVLRNETMYLQLPQSHNLKGMHQLVATDYMVGYRPMNQSYYSLLRSPVTVNVYQDTLIGKKHIISGKFQGTLYGYSYSGTPLTDSIKLTGGVFDVAVND